MTPDNVTEAYRQAKRFMQAVDALNSAELLAREERDRLSYYVPSPYSGTALSGAVRRSSMDLTRALAKMRKS